MKCPSCGAATNVGETRSRDELERRRKCHTCGLVFQTVEILKSDYVDMVAQRQTMIEIGRLSSSRLGMKLVLEEPEDTTGGSSPDSSGAV